MSRQTMIAAESQSDVLANGTSYVNTLRRNRGISSSLDALTPELYFELILYNIL